MVMGATMPRGCDISRMKQVIRWLPDEGLRAEDGEQGEAFGVLGAGLSREMMMRRSLPATVSTSQSSVRGPTCG